MLDWLLPPRCLLCGGPSGPVCLCPPCRSELPWSGPHCRRCGLPLGSPRDLTCGACLRRPPPFMQTVCPLRYEFPVDRLVQAFKFRRQLVAGRILSHLLYETLAVPGAELPDQLIPVPLHPLRMLTRGFNQSWELGSYLGRRLHIPIDGTGLRRRRHTPAQSGLSRRQRRRNVRGAFCWRGRKAPAHHVALIDDVMTTGTTLAECARVLKRAGARRVDLWVAARAVPGPPG